MTGFTADISSVGSSSFALELTLETSAFNFATYGDQLSLSTLLVIPNFVYNSPTEAAAASQNLQKLLALPAMT